MTGKCIYCGRAEESLFWRDENEATVAVTRSCSCPDATRQRLAEAVRDTMAERFDEEKLGYELHRMLTAAMLAVACGDIGQAAFALNDGRKLRFKPGKSPETVNINISRSSSIGEDVALGAARRGAAAQQLRQPARMAEPEIEETEV